MATNSVIAKQNKKAIKNNKKQAFTLVEMLIVIVIIGVLASALIPRLTSVQGRSRDSARTTALNQLGSSMAIYYSDFGAYPETPQTLNNYADILVPNYIDEIPTDPQNAKRVQGIVYDSIGCADPDVANNGHFGYTPLERAGVSENGFMIMATTETDSSSNWVFDPGADAEYVFSEGTIRMDAGCVTTGTRSEDIKKLQSLNPRVTQDAVANESLSGFVADEDAANMRYIYSQ